MIMRGKFITLEGSEGVGKSSNLAAVCEVLAAAGIDYFQTREPGGTAMAEAIREIMLGAWDESVDGLTELLLVFAARNQHVCEEILPRLEQGQWVVCDRFTDATYAYQGSGRGLDLAQISTLEQWVQGQLQPHLTIYLDLDPQVGQARISNRALDRMEQESADFFLRRAPGLPDRAAAHERFALVDASLPLTEVQAKVRDVVRAFVERGANE